MMRVLEVHHCSKQHRSAATFVRCRFVNARVAGSGQLALFLHCEVPLRVMLCRRLEQARNLATEYDVFGCGPNCTRDHELVAIDIDAPALVARATEPDLDQETA